MSILFMFRVGTTGAVGDGEKMKLAAWRWLGEPELGVPPWLT